MRKKKAGQAIKEVKIKTGMIDLNRQNGLAVFCTPLADTKPIDSSMDKAGFAIFHGWHSNRENKLFSSIGDIKPPLNVTIVAFRGGWLGDKPVSIAHH